MTGTVPCRVIVTAGEQETDLGLCVPTGGCFGLETSIPIKRIGEGMLSFRAQTRHRELPGTFLSVHPDEPFRYIARLKDAYLARRDGRTGIVIREAEAGSPVPQGSGQIP